jgi:hypothetical protein
MQNIGWLIGVAQVANQGTGPSKGVRWLPSSSQAPGHQGGDACPGSSGQALGRILDRHNLPWNQAQQRKGPLVPLGIGLFSRHILTANPNGQLGH